jgi:hypothetical protein
MRRLEGRGAAEVVPLAMLQEKLVELLLLSSRWLSQQLAEEGSHGGGTHTAELSDKGPREPTRGAAQLTERTNARASGQWATQDRGQTAV